MGSLIYFLIFGALFFVMMRFGCGAHIMGRGPAGDGARAESRDAVAGPAVGLSVLPEVAKDSRALRVQLPGNRAYGISVFALGLASSVFLSLSYVLCVLSYVLFPSMPIAHGLLSLVLPGFELLTVRSFFLGLVESLGWGWYISLIFGPLYNYFALQFGRIPW